MHQLTKQQKIENLQEQLERVRTKRDRLDLNIKQMEQKLQKLNITEQSSSSGARPLGSNPIENLRSEVF